MYCVNASIKWVTLNIIKNFFTIQKEFEINYDSFFPKPHVKSVVFSIIKKSNSNFKENIDKKKYLFFLKKMFLNRRKTLYENLKFYLRDDKKTLAIFNENKISTLSRPEEIKSDIYLNIFKKII